jgi:hypothetical protein
MVIFKLLFKALREDGLNLGLLSSSSQVLELYCRRIVICSRVLYSDWKFITLKSSIHYSWLQFTTLLEF